MPQHGKLSPAEIRAVDAWVKDHLKTDGLCPISQDDNWVTLNLVVHSSTFIVTGDTASEEDAKVYPTVMQMCTTCGYIRTFSAMKIGLYEKD